MKKCFDFSWLIVAFNCSVTELGSGGPEFKSPRPDQKVNKIEG